MKKLGRSIALVAFVLTAAALVWSSAAQAQDDGFEAKLCGIRDDGNVFCGGALQQNCKYGYQCL